jgi:hypothetical protein
MQREKRVALVVMLCATCAGGLHAQEIYGTEYNGPGATLTVDGQDLMVYGNVQNFGTVLILPNNTLWAEGEFQNSGTVQIFGAQCSSVKTFRNNFGATIEGYGNIHSDTAINNKGLIQSLAGSLVVSSWADPKITVTTNSGVLKNSPGTTLAVMSFGPDVSNQGTVEINAEGTVTFDGKLTNEPNGIVKLLGGTLAASTVVEKAGATLQGFGGITGNITIDPGAAIILTGATNIVGDVAVAKGGELEIRDQTVLVTGKVNCDGTIRLKGGHLIPQGGLSGSYKVIHEPSMYAGIGL